MMVSRVMKKSYFTQILTPTASDMMKPTVLSIHSFSSRDVPVIARDAVILRVFVGGIGKQEV